MDAVSPSFPSRLSKGIFMCLVIVVLALGIVSVVLVGLWTGYYTSEGFQWTSKGKYNLHPFILTTGLVFIYGNATLCYRVLGRLRVPRRCIKIIHAVMMVVVIATAALGLYLDFGIFANFGTLHAIIGLATIALIVLQFIFATFIFALPYAPGWLRASYMWPHSFFGMLTLVLATATCLTGTDIGQNHFALNKPISLSFGMILTTFTGTVSYIVCNKAYRIKKGESKTTTIRPDYGTVSDTSPLY